FFCQAEDGIRDFHVTGVQTCALPIYRQYIEARYQHRSIQLDYYKAQLYYQLPVFSGKADILTGAYASWLKSGREEISGEVRAVRSEERRVGTDGWWRRPGHDR